MNPNQGPTTPNLQPTLPEDLSFADIVAVQELRNQQQEAIDAARQVAFDEALKPDADGKISIDQAFKANGVMNEAEDETKSTFGDMRKSYLDSHLSRDSNPEAYDKLLFMLETVSADKMGPMQWQMGDEDAEGNRNHPETSGQAMVKALLEHLRAEYPANTPPAPTTPNLLNDKPTTPEYQAAVAELEDARKKLAAVAYKQDLMIRKKHGRKTRHLQDAYNTADAEYHAKLTAAHALLIKHWRNSGHDNTAVLTNSVHAVLDEHQQFSQAELAVMQADDTRRAKVARWLSKRHRFIGLSIPTNMGAGFGLYHAAVAVGVASGVGMAVAIPSLTVVNGARAGYTATIGNRVNQIKRFSTRYNEDHSNLQHAAESISHDGVIDYQSKAALGATALRNIIRERVQKDIKDNRHHVRNAALISGTASGAGMFLGEVIATDFHPFGWGLHHGSGHGGTGGHGSGYQPPKPGTQGQRPGYTPPSNPHGGGYQFKPGPPPAHTSPPAGHTPAAHSGVLNPHHATETIKSGEGYYQAIRDTFSQNGQHLSGAGVRDLYSHMAHEFHGNFFTNDASYRMAGTALHNAPLYGIDHAGVAQWHANVLHFMNEWAKNNPDKFTTISKTTKHAGKVAAKAAVAAMHKSGTLTAV
ncbi:MAG TPA: hypothetical protein VF261_00105 [Candidatus Saccharimonadales bacterium]